MPRIVDFVQVVNEANRMTHLARCDNAGAPDRTLP
jgi:hypothetical protein